MPHRRGREAVSFLGQTAPQPVQVCPEVLLHIRARAGAAEHSPEAAPLPVVPLWRLQLDAGLHPGAERLQLRGHAESQAKTVQDEEDEEQTHRKRNQRGRDLSVFDVLLLVPFVQLNSLSNLQL